MRHRGREIDGAYEAGNYTIAPDKSRAVQNWDVAICVALIYTALVTPAEVGFIHDRNKDNPVRLGLLRLHTDCELSFHL